MIRPGHYYALTVWAAREILYQPARGLLLFACTSSLAFLVGTALLFSQALDTTWSHLLDQAPALIIRRVDAGGWAPMPAAAALAAARTVPGVLDPTPRLWGVAAGPGGPATVVGSLAPIPHEIRESLTPPAAGQAVVGQTLAGRIDDHRLTLSSVNTLHLAVTGTFPASTRLATGDVVWLTAADARHLFGLLPDQVSDLAVHLFRREEEKAIQADLAAAFPWPVHITDRSTSAGRHHSFAMRTGGIAVVAAVPALLALLLIMTSAGTGGSRSRWALLQTLGWTTGDLVALNIARALIVGTPALLCGLALAYMAVFYPPAAGITAAWIAGGQRLPTLALDNGGAILSMLEIAAMIGLPYLAAVFLASVRSISSDPWTLLQADAWK